MSEKCHYIGSFKLKKWTEMIREIWQWIWLVTHDGCLCSFLNCAYLRCVNKFWRMSSNGLYSASERHSAYDAGTIDAVSVKQSTLQGWAWWQARSKGVVPVGRPPKKFGQIQFLRSTFLSVSAFFYFKTNNLVIWFSDKSLNLLLTLCQILGLKCTKFKFGTPDRAGGAYSAPQIP